jgi:ABC-type glycerol-3-phosphate transport system substrate-binding protein
VSEGFSRRDFLAGVLATGTLSATATYLAPGGRPLPPVRLTLMTGHDPTGGRNLLIDMWNQANPNTSVLVDPVGGSTLDQRDAMISGALSGRADILNLDLIHIPHFADEQYITPIEVDNVHDFLPQTLKASLWGMEDNSPRLWAVPFNTDVGMLFERLRPDADTTSTPPELRQVVHTLPDGSSTFAGQLQPSSSSSDEIFVVNMYEHALSENQSILDEADGSPSYELKHWQDALSPLQQAIAAGRIRRCDDEDDTTVVFSSAGLRFMRNWPLQYRVLLQSPDPEASAARIRVSPLPTGILGGQSLALAKNSRHPSRAQEFIRFLTDSPAQKILAAHGLAPTRTAPYTDASLLAFIPHLEQMRGAVEQAHLRPLHPRYGELTRAVAKHMRNFLNEQVQLPSQFVYDMQEVLERR